MIKNDLTDTIAAIATALGFGGIGIVRISGKEALNIADKIFVSVDKNGKPSNFKTYTTHYGIIVNKGSIIDEVILTVMLGPKSYTKEDIVEINCHGGIVALTDVLNLVLENGARLAEPGEFTKRAFLNGRIDLAQAEAVLDIIRAKTDSALKVSVNQLKGSLSGQINKYRTFLLDILAQLEANIDFPEEEISQGDYQAIIIKIREINNGLLDLINNSKLARVLREGIHVVICGCPNVGKSSLLNALLKEERSIVTSVAGTTRDTIEEMIDIKGIPVKVVDTAGILKPRDSIEKKAVLRSRKQIDSADLVIMLFDGSKKLTPEDLELALKLRKKPVIALVNKMDLRQNIQRERIEKIFKHVIDISAKKIKNINLLEEAIADLVYAGRLIRTESIMISNLRHIKILQKAQKDVAEIIKSLDNELSLELVAQGIKEVLEYLDDILGKRFSEDLLDKIFSEFCIGK